jgi:hypothetical protein
MLLRIATLIVFLALLLNLTLRGAMSDAKAMQVARDLYGIQARIAHIRGINDTYWTKQIGYNSTGCRQPFTVLGAAPNTWDAAFAAVSPNAVIGPYSGIISIKQQVWDDHGLESVRIILDGNTIATIQWPKATYWQIEHPWDTHLAAEGVHVLCASVRDQAGNIGRSEPLLFRINQSVASIKPVIEWAGNSAPVVSNGMTILQK